MKRSIITGSGLFTPADSISNAELVESHVAAAEKWNRDRADEIAAGSVEERDPSSVRFIVKASGIHSRHVMEKSGVLDPERMRPHLPRRSEDEPSIQCEISLVAIRGALVAARREPHEIDAVLVACSNLQRAYPAVAIEVQAALGAGGFAYDLNVACSSATFGIQAAVDAIANGSARRVVVVNPEITSGHNNFALRDSHFIFGDACTAVLVEEAGECRVGSGFEVLSTRLETHFSNNIRNDFGFLNACEEPARAPRELLFRQNGRQVAREVSPMVAKHILEHLAKVDLSPRDLRRLWLHQANLRMNEMIGKSVLGREPDAAESPVILDEYANTSSAGSVIAFHRFNADLATGDVGILCSFGAGYSIGSAILRKVDLGTTPDREKP